MIPVCCRRPDAAPPNMNSAVANTLLGIGHRARQPMTAIAIPPASRWANTTRSEERRVGKEGRSRWSPYHYKKKSEALGEGLYVSVNAVDENRHPACFETV